MQFPKHIQEIFFTEAMSTTNDKESTKAQSLGAIGPSKPQLLMLDHIEAKKTIMVEHPWQVCSGMMPLQTCHGCSSDLKLERCIVTPRPDNCSIGRAWSYTCPST